MLTRRRLLEGIRRAHQTDAAYTAACRARSRASKAAADAHARITHDLQLQSAAGPTSQPASSACSPRRPASSSWPRTKSSCPRAAFCIQ